MDILKKGNKRGKRQKGKIHANGMNFVRKKRKN